LQEVHIGDREVLGYIKHPPDDTQKFHVTLLDGCLQMTILSADSSNTYLPVQIGKMIIYSPLSKTRLQNQTLVAYAHQTSFEGMLYLKGNVILATEDGTVLATLQDFVGQCINNHTGVDVNKCVYKNIWQPKQLSLLPAPSAASLPPLSKWQEELDKIGEVEHNTSKMEELVCGYIHLALAKLDSGEIIANPRLAKYIKKLREIHDEKRSKFNYDSVTPYYLQELANELDTKLPQAKTELFVFTKIAAALPDIFRDPMVAIHILYAPETLTQFFADSLSMRVYYQWIAEAVKETVEKIYSLYGKDRVVRILELGARSGGLTAHIAPHLAKYGEARRLEYIFGDPKSDFFANAQKKLAAYDFIKYKEIDLEHDPETQGFTSGQYDIVIALNTIHATARMDHALTSVHSLLSADGWAIIMDPTNVPMFADLIFGALDVWWAFSDFRVDQGHCCLSRKDWRATLPRFGFEAPVEIVSPGEWVNSIFVTRRQHVDAKAIIHSPTKNSLGKHSAPTHYVVFSDGSETARHFIESVGSDRCLVFMQSDKDWRAKWKEWALSSHDSWVDGTSQCGIIYMWSYPVYEDPDPAMEATVGVYHLVHALHEVDAIKYARVWVVTQGALVEGTCPSGALPVGTLRTIANELQELGLYSVDLEHGVSAQKHVSQLFDVIIGKYGHENEIALRGDNCLGLRVINEPYTAPFSPLVSSTNGGSRPSGFQLTLGEPGNLDSLKFTQIRSQELRPDEVRVRVKCAGFNFKDLMHALNLLDDLSHHTEKAYQLGHEFSGVVEEVGSAVQGVKVGDEVMGATPYGGTFASHLICNEHHMVPKPKNLTFEQAGGAPVVFTTAYYALVTLGRLRKGDTVLIHSAAGGLGQAAIQIAHMIGAKVIGTAGSDAKREFLRTQRGVECVADSHSLDFVRTVKEFTNNRGVNVILNSLAGDAIAAGISVLAFGGRFVEVGKRDILKNSKIDMLPFLMNKSFLSAHIDLMLQHDPQSVNDIMREVGTLLEQSKLQAPATSVYHIEKSVEVFRTVQHNQHLGKLVLQIPEGFVPKTVAPSEEIYVPDAAYLITGGLGGVGLSLAISMAERGARNIILMGRRLPDTPKVKAILAKIAQLGTRYHILLGDISNPRDADKPFEWAASQGIPLRGIWHFATTLDDGFILNMSEESFRHVYPPKGRGAWNLHLRTLAEDVQKNLDFFVLASSVSGILGNLEQANYAPPCTYLDMLAMHRQQKGLRCMAVQMGLLRGAGLVERSRNISRIAKLRGFFTLHISEMVQQLERFIQNQEQGIIQFAHHNWDILVRGVKENSRISHNLPFHKKAAEGGDRMSTEQMLEVASKQVGKMLFLDDAVPIDQPLVSFGVDSLISTELVSWFKNSLHLTVSQMDIFSGVSLQELLSKATDGK
jgi:NADPH:quinone reductase-like Zn-dependent oxidoreductase/SAM-dependent methyltransferase